MMSVRVSTSISAATKGSAELNHRNLNEPKELHLMVKRGLKKDESRTNDDASGNNGIELNDAVKQKHQQAQVPVIQWDRFLPLRSLKVLLVEDDDSTRHFVSALLRNCSYEVTAVANGLEAWKVLIDLNKQIDLVLTEVVMPHLSGIGLLSKIMNFVPRKDTPVIMMSSDASMGIVFNCLSKGAVDFLVKPIRKNELKNLWQHVWRKCHSSSGSESESGVGAHKPTKARNTEISDDESDDSDKDDDMSIGRTANDGSGTQSSWSKRAGEVNSTKYSRDQLAGAPDGTCAQVVHARPNSTREHVEEDNNLDMIDMGKDLKIGANSTNNEMIAKTNDFLNSKCSPALELSLKRSLVVEDTAGTRKRNVLKHSHHSAFSRYSNTTSNTNQASSITKVGSCSPLAATISSEAANTMNIQSNSNGASNQRSNGSSTLNYDMGSSTNNALDDKPNEGYKVARFEVSHHVHNIQQQQQERAKQNDGSSRNVASNGLSAPAETDYESASGSNSNTNGQNGNTGVTEKGKFGNVCGSVVDQVQDRSAQREAALNKFRQKRKERCFEKKVRYESRKKLAEQRPRVRGQFVRQGGKDAYS